MKEELRVALAKRIYHTAHLTGQFTLRSGATSTEYFDKYLFEADPDLLKHIAIAMVKQVPPGIDALAGLEMGGIPLGTMLSQLTGLPLLFVRKKAKNYGTCKIAEGGRVKGRKLLIIEDVVTSGGAILEAAKSLREEGAELGIVLGVIDRESGGAANLEKEGLKLQALFTMSELKAAGGS